MRTFCVNKIFTSCVSCVIPNVKKKTYLFLDPDCDDYAFDIKDCMQSFILYKKGLSLDRNLPPSGRTSRENDSEYHPIGVD